MHLISKLNFVWMRNQYAATALTLQCWKKSVCVSYAFIIYFNFPIIFSLLSHFWKDSLCITKWRKSQVNGSVYLFRFQAVLVRLFWSSSQFQAVFVTEATNNFPPKHPLLSFSFVDNKLDFFSGLCFVSSSHSFIVWLQTFVPYLFLV